jgi:subtilase family serine protease
MLAPWSHRFSAFGAALLLTLSASAQADKPADKAPTEISARPPLHVHRFNALGPVGFIPSQIRHAYGFDQLTAPTLYNRLGYGQTIAIVDAYGSPTIQQDLNAFSARFGLPIPPVWISYPTGLPARTDAGWALETALDVEWAHAIAPAATILLVVAKSASFADLLPAVDYAASHARQVSMSWGGSEFSSEASYDYHFNRSGVTFIAAAGDNGASVEWPAASPYVTSVGGTSLYLDSSNNRISEVAWAGSGGGISSYEIEPSYQRAWQSTGSRMVPDVSFAADPNTGMAVYDSTPFAGSTGWIEVGGTSAGAPQWAAVAALLNAGRYFSPVGPANGSLYAMSSSSSYRTCFDDVTSGSNGGYPAGPGYDLVTGLGSPLANTLVPDLIASGNGN